jgi:RND superfamily putative drug exporter
VYAGREDRWVRVVRHVVRRPVVALALSLPPLLLLGAAATRLVMGLHDVRSLPTGIESARALDRLSDMGRAEVALGLRTIVTLPDGQTIFDDAGWATIGRIERALLADPRIADVRSIRTVSGGVPPAAVRSVFPESGLRTFTSRDETRALIDVIPVRGTGARAAATLVRDLRVRHAGATMQIGGVPAYSVDYADAIAAHAVRAVALASVGAFFVLLLAFRSVLVAVKAVALNLLSAAAAVGATVLVFQEGIPGPLSGLSTPLDGVVPTVPLLVFCAVFGIGMDYEVFLLARIFRARRDGASDEESIVHGVAASAPLITRAATIMVAVFIAFAMGDFIVIRMIGFALATAVAIDATLIRLVVAPALMRIAGRWNWWPGERHRAANDFGTVRQHAVQSAP